MPKDEHSAQICPKSKNHCMEIALEEIEMNAWEKDSPAGKCDCLSSCHALEYQQSITASTIVNANDLKISQEIKNQYPNLTG